MTMPKFFTPTFIGTLKEKEAEHKGNDPVWFRICTAVKQCREYNDCDDQERREAILFRMGKTQQELAELGVMVG